MSRFVRGRTPVCEANWGTNPNKKTLRREFFYSRSEGFEPPTFWFVAKRSIQLSYERIFGLLDNHIKNIKIFQVKCQKIFKTGNIIKIIVK